MHLLAVLAANRGGTAALETERPCLGWQGLRVFLRRTRAFPRRLARWDAGRRPGSPGAV